MVVALANPPAQLQSPTLLHSTEQRGQACPASDLVHVPHSLILFIVEILNMFIYANFYLIAKFAFNYNIWHYVKKALNFVVDELMYVGESSTSRLIFWLVVWLHYAHIHLSYMT